jgi:tRNA pseudouridine55 synthase
MSGFLLIDKPEGLTSFTIVAQARRLLKIEKGGHCGTLDPLATGLLILCFGKATKLAQFVSVQTKKYVAEITFGYTSTTYDRGGELTPSGAVASISDKDIAEALEMFRGTITQLAPAYSAVKHQGRPLYDYARKNIAVEPKQRTVSVEALEVLEYEYPRLTLAITCSTGTYIRSLAHDLGARLGTGGYISQLRRISIGASNVSDAITLAQLEKRTAPGIEASGSARERLLSELLIPMDTMLHLPDIYLSPERAGEVCRGVPIRVKDVVQCGRAIVPEELVALRSQSGNLLAIGRSLYASEQLQGLAEEKAVEYIRVV